MLRSGPISGEDSEQQDYAEFETAVMKQKAVRNKRKAPQMIKDSEAENKEAGQLEDEKEAKIEAMVEAAKDEKQKQKKRILVRGLSLMQKVKLS